MLSNTTDLDRPPTRPLSRHGQLEVDVFCQGCGYNLHGQIVELDERLGFLICRCPECSRYHPAGTGTSANSVWLTRLGTLCLLAWVGIVIIATLLITLAMGGLQAGTIEPFTYGHPESADHRLVDELGYTNGVWGGYVIHGTKIPVTKVLYVHTLEPDSSQSYSGPNNDLSEFFTPYRIISAVSALLGFIFGALIVTFLWHWPRWRYLVALIFPMIAAGFVIMSHLTDASYYHIYSWCVKRALIQMAIQCTGVFLGILFGRPLARAFVKSIIPPKPRQLLAFLWRIDGKTPPMPKPQ